MTLDDCYLSPRTSALRKIASSRANSMSTVCPGRRSLSASAKALRLEVLTPARTKRRSPCLSPAFSAPDPGCTLASRRQIIGRLLQNRRNLGQSRIIDLLSCVRRAVVIGRIGSKQLHGRNAGFYERGVVRCIDRLRDRLRRYPRHGARTHEDERE